MFISIHKNRKCSAYTPVPRLISIASNHNSSNLTASVFDSHLFELNFFLFSTIQAATALLASGCSAATAVAYIAKNGNEHAGWLAICGYMDSYCNRGGISLACSYAAFIVFFLLAATTMKGPRQTTAASY